MIRIPGQAPRAGHPIRRTRPNATSSTAATASRPSAIAPGEYAAPALRIDTNADAHSTTVTPAAARAAVFCRSAMLRP